jgi:hypothetical protein
VAEGADAARHRAGGAGAAGGHGSLRRAVSVRTTGGREKCRPAPGLDLTVVADDHGSDAAAEVTSGKAGINGGVRIGSISCGTQARADGIVISASRAKMNRGQDRGGSSCIRSRPARWTGPGGHRVTRRRERGTHLAAAPPDTAHPTFDAPTKSL